MAGSWQETSGISRVVEAATGAKRLGSESPTGPQPLCSLINTFLPICGHQEAARGCLGAPGKLLVIFEPFQRWADNVALLAASKSRPSLIAALNAG